MIKVSADEFAELAVAFGDLYRALDHAFVEVLGFRRAQVAWRVWYATKGSTFADFSSCFEIVSW